MSNPIIEIPEEIKANAQRVLDGRENFISSTVELAEFILGLNKTEIEVQNFVVYKVKYANMFYAGFRFEASHIWKNWLIVELGEAGSASFAIPQIGTAILAVDEEIEVLERWTPEPVFGIGEPDDEVATGQTVLVKGVLSSAFVDSDGDVRVEMIYSDGLADAHYVSAKDVAYSGEGR